MFIQNTKEIRQEKQRKREIAREERIQERLDEEAQFREEEKAAVQKAREEEEKEKKRGEKQAEAEKESQRRRSQRLRENLNHKYTQIAWYVVITAVILYILLKILDHLGEIGAAIGAGLGWMSVLLKPLVIGFAIAYLLYPLDNFFQRQLLKIPWFRKKRFSARGLAVGMTAILVAGILAVSLSAIVSTVTRELTVFHVDDIDRLLSSLQSSMNSFYNSVIRVMHNFSISSDQLTEYLEPLQTAVVDWAGDLAKSVAGGVRHLPATLSTTIFAIIFGVYFQLDGEGLKKYWSHALKAITTWNAYNNIRNFFRDADSRTAGGCDVYGRCCQYFPVPGRHPVCDCNRDSDRYREPDPICRPLCGIRFHHFSQSSALESQKADYCADCPFYHSDNRRKCDKSEISQQRD